jgi:uncharacterized protein YqjF (DUF2071 family)
MSTPVIPPLPPWLDLPASPVLHGRASRIRQHRPWPLPRRPWVMGQTWSDLLFAHWDVAPEALASAVPPQLSLDTFDGQAWVGVTPFRVHNLRARLTLPVPVLSSFPELNVRTYVVVGDKPGIFFFSLDAASSLAVAAARRLYRLPYFRADMSSRRIGAETWYVSQRRDSEAVAPATFQGSYRPTGSVFHPRAGTLEHWLTERYCLYTLDDRQRVLRGEIHHPPWPLQPAQADIRDNTMGDQIGLELQGSPRLHYSARQDVIFWRLEAA